MPGKVNPVIPEVVNQVCCQVIGNDVVVSMGLSGQLQLNAFEPVIAFNIFFSMSMLRSAANVLRENVLLASRPTRSNVAIYLNAPWPLPRL